MGIENEPNNKEMLIKEILESPQNIEREFQGTDNPWLACVNTRLQVISAYLSFAIEDGQISTEEGEGPEEKLQEITDRIRGLQYTYSKKEDTVPEEIKKEILSKLDILK